MKTRSWWSTPIVAIGSSAAVAATLLHYAQAHRAGVPGGYFAIWFGALGVGLLAGATGYFSAPEAHHVVQKAIVVTAVVSLATAGVLLVALTWAFGS